MPTVTLLKRECQKNKLPKVCMKCGEPATVQVRRNFVWTSMFVMVVFLGSVLFFPLLIFSIVLTLASTRRMVVYAPMCKKHKNHWSIRFEWLTGSGVLVVLFCLAVFIFGFGQRPQGAPVSDLATYMCIGSLVLLLAWGLLLAYLMDNAVRPSLITEQNITLRRVHPDFVEAVEEWRRNKMFNNYYKDDVADQPKPPGNRPPVRDQADDGPKPRKKKNTPWYDEE